MNTDILDSKDISIKRPMYPIDNIPGMKMEQAETLGLLSRALELDKNGQYEEAISAFHTVLSFHDERGKAFELYYEAIRESDLERRIRHLERAKEATLYLDEVLRENPGAHAKPFFDLAQQHFLRLREAERLCLDEFYKTSGISNTDREPIPLGIGNSF